jgi:hypothetical protein
VSIVPGMEWHSPVGGRRWVSLLKFVHQIPQVPTRDNRLAALLVDAGLPGAGRDHADERFEMLSLEGTLRGRWSK